MSNLGTSTQTFTKGDTVKLRGDDRTFTIDSGPYKDMFLTFYYVKSVKSSCILEVRDHDILPIG